ncbi:MAG: hypothetical protein IZT55_06780 [Anaerolineae bacterium]|nr:hypothetical protein [Anaerolineae bacterium]
MMSNSERIEILEMIDNGTITPEEGLRLLAAIDHQNTDEIFDDESPLLEDQSFSDEQQAGAGSVTNRIEPEEIQRWKRWWSVPLWIGMLIVILSSIWMRNAWNNNVLGFWFFCSWIPMLLGILMMALSWNSRTSQWLHIRVHQSPGEKPERIAISIPLPLRFSAWVVRTFGHYIPNFNASGIDEVIMALHDTKMDHAQLIVDVKDEEDGDHIQIFIG